MRVKCLTCKNEFEIRLSRIKLNKGKFCSRECYKKRIKKLPIVLRKCKYCHKNFMSCRNQFCSRQCYWKSKKGKTFEMQGRTPVSVKTKEKMSFAKLGDKNPRFGEVAINKGIKALEKTKEKIRKARAEQIITEEHKEAIRKGNSTPKNKEIHRQVMLKNLQNPIYQDTIPEKMIEEELVKMNIGYEKQVPLPKDRPLSLVDFFLPKSNTVTYVDGNYWHTRPMTIIRDKGINVILKNRGYNVLRFWESDIKKVDKRKQIIEEIIKCV